MKKKVFISLPMSNRSKAEIETDIAYYFADAEKRAGEELELINSLLSDEEVSSLMPLTCLSKSLECMSLAHYVYFGKGWDTARGCKIEHECAKEYGYKILKD